MQRQEKLGLIPCGEVKAKLPVVISKLMTGPLVILTVVIFTNQYVNISSKVSVYYNTIFTVKHIHIYTAHS